ncbi:T9SS type B sorting domain-containing protein [bacterium]|nr:T9SS type B sorting domain-containing protein [bacterium]
MRSNAFFPGNPIGFNRLIEPNTRLFGPGQLGKIASTFHQPQPPPASVKYVLTTVWAWIFLASISLPLSAQERWLSGESANTYGTGVLLAPSDDGGSYVLSRDLFELTRFDRCGVALWNRTISPGRPSGLAVHLISRQGGGIVALFRFDNAGRYGALMVAVDGQGTVLWSELLDDPAFSYIPYTLGSDAEGRLHVFGHVTEIPTNEIWLFLSSFDPQGSVRWSKLVGDGGIWGGSTSTSDGGFLLRSGNRLVKLNPAGNFEWGRRYDWDVYDYQAPIEHPNGYALSGYALLDQDVSWLSVQFNGIPTNNGLFRLDMPTQSPRLTKSNNGSLGLSFTQSEASGSRWSVITLDNQFRPATAVSVTPFSGTGHQTPDEMAYSSEGELLGAGTRAGNLFLAQLGSDPGLPGFNCLEALSLPGVVVSTATSSAWTPSINAGILPWTTASVLPAVGSVDPLYQCQWTPQLDLGPDTAFCGSGRFAIGDRDGDKFDQYRWSTGARTPEIEVSQSGVYWLEVQSGCSGTVQTDTIQVLMLAATFLDFPEQFALCAEENLRIEAPSCANCSYWWSTGSRNADLEPQDTGTYWLELTASNGCASIDTFRVVDAQCYCAAYLADAFTPNDDDLNESYGPVLDCRETFYRFEVYDRWGKLLYASLDPDYRWDGTVDGKPCPSGVYGYRLSLRAEIRAVEQNLEDQRGRFVLMR